MYKRQLYYSADQIHHGALPRHVHFVLDEFAAMPLPGYTRELATMRSRNISSSTIIQNMAQIKELYKDSWETIPGNSDTILYPVSYTHLVSAHQQRQMRLSAAGVARLS